MAALAKLDPATILLIDPARAVQIAVSAAEMRSRYVLFGSEAHLSVANSLHPRA